MGLNSTLRRGGTSQRSTSPTAETPSSTRVSGISTGSLLPIGEIKSGAADIMQGRISLIMLDTLVLVLLGFYVWTHNAQGGG